LTGFAAVCPITRKQKGYPFEVELPDGLAVYGVILPDQFKSVGWKARREGSGRNRPGVFRLDFHHFR